MTTKTTMGSDLEIAKQELVELQSRLARAKDTHDRIEIELKELQARRLDPSASEDRNAQGRTVQLKALLTDEADAIASLEHAVEERGKLVAQLSHDAAKANVGAECSALEDGFGLVMDLLKGHIPEMSQWITAANEAHNRYASVNRSQNESLKEKLAILGYLMEYIANQPRRYL